MHRDVSLFKNMRENEKLCRALGSDEVIIIFQRDIANELKIEHALCLLVILLQFDLKQYSTLSFL